MDDRTKIQLYFVVNANRQSEIYNAAGYFFKSLNEAEDHAKAWAKNCPNDIIVLLETKKTYKAEDRPVTMSDFRFSDEAS